MNSTQRVERARATHPAPEAPPVAVNQIREREDAAQRDLAVGAALQRAVDLAFHENPVGNDDHLRGFQQLERAIQLLPADLTASVAQKWTHLAADMLRNQAQPKHSGWSKREQIRALHREVAEIFEKVRADRSDARATSA